MIRAFTILFLSALSCGLFAAQHTDSLRADQAELVSNAAFELKSSRYDQIQSTLSTPQARDFFVEKSYGVVMLSFPEPYPAAGSVSLTLELQYETLENNALHQHTRTVSLALDFGAHRPAAWVRLDNALKINAEITAISDISALDDLVLDFTIHSEVYQKMTYTETVSGIGKDLSYIDSMGSLRVYWEPQSKAGSYELEWTYVSNQDTTDPDQTIPVSSINLHGKQLFRNNSSRVEITDTSYFIPLIYERGVIFYRVRPVGKNLSGDRPVTVKGAWTLGEDFTSTASVGSAHYYEYAGLEQKLNWQSSISFAEEGKNKVVLSYHDGTARNRQAVTRINSDARSVVGETFYDYNGRPVIQVLPVPVTENNLYYFPDFNRIDSASTAVPMYKASYDQSEEGDGCTVNAPALDTLHGGAAQYYSAQNPFGTDGNTGQHIINRDLIPNAEQYPYTQTRYTADNTGRIAAQSGVGKAHRLDTGHETKYLYGVPDDEELIRLFGREIGYSGHYKKNVVIDPNGQVSVSYLDMDGKVVATALAGGSPAAVDQLAGEPGRSITTQLLNTITNALGADKISKEYTKKVVVAENNTSYQINYKLEAQPYTIQCLDRRDNEVKSLSLSSLLDIRLQLLDCGTPLIDTLLSIDAPFGSMTSQQRSYDGIILLQQGEYVLSKRVQINEDKLEDYLRSYVQDASYACVIPVGDYIHDSIATVDLSGCGYSCEGCQDNIEALILTLDSSRTDAGEPLLSETEKEDLRSRCYDLCRSNIACASALNGMLGDMSIGGQYGEIRDNLMSKRTVPSIDRDDFNDVGNINEERYDVDLHDDGNGLDGNLIGTPITSLDVEKFRLSVFNTSNLLKNHTGISGIRPDYRYPIRIVGGACPDQPQGYNQCLMKDELDLSQVTYHVTDYYGTDGKKVYAKVVKGEGNTWFPEFHAEGLSALVTVDEELGEYKIPIRYLKDIAIFELYWKPHFSNYLVFYHPEYPYLVQCTQQYDINEFEYRLVTTETLAEDTEHMFFNNLGEAVIIDNDPLFAEYPQLKTPFSLLFRSYKSIPGGPSLSMVQVANLGSECPVSSVTCPGLTCPATTIDPDDRFSWSLFKSMYISERQKLLRKLSIKEAIAGNYYNGCIGDPDFRLEDEAAEFFRAIPYQVVTTVPQIICVGRWWWTQCFVFPRNVQNTRYAYPFLNSAQTCQIWRSRFYQDKTRIFYPKQYDLGGSMAQGRCVRELYDSVTDTTYEVEVNCVEDDERYINEVNNTAMRLRYEQCGLCPLASDLQDFLVTTQRSRLLDSDTAVVLGCPPGVSALQLGGALTREFMVGGIMPPLDWKGSYHTGTRTLTGQLVSYQDAGRTIADKTIGLTLDFSSFPAGIPVAFDSLRICCLNPTGATTFDMKVSYRGYYHTATDVWTASLDLVPQAQQSNYREASFTVSGTVSGMRLDTCTIAPNCALTSVARNMTGFLNVLNMEMIGEKSRHMVSDTVRLWQDSLIYFYEYPLRALMDINGVSETGDLLIELEDIKPKWRSSVTGSRLDGELLYGEDDVLQLSIEPEQSMVSLDYTQVEYFTNLRPVNDVSGCPGNDCPTGKFTADAVTLDSNERKRYTRVLITVPLYTMTICRKAVVQGN